VTVAKQDRFAKGPETATKVAKFWAKMTQNENPLWAKNKAQCFVDRQCN